MPYIKLTCPVTLVDLTEDNFKKALLIIVGTTVYPILPSKNDELSAEDILKQLKLCPITRLGAYKRLELSVLPEDLETKLKKCLSNEEEKEPIKTSDLAKILVDEDNQFHKFLTDKTFQTLQLPPLLDGVLTAVQFEQLARDTQEVITSFNNAERIHDLMTRCGLLFNHIQQLSSHSLRHLARFPAVTQLAGFTFRSLTTLNSQKAEFLCVHSMGVNAVSQLEGASLDNLDRLDANKLSMLLQSYAGVNAVSQLEGATFDKLADLDDEKLSMLLRNPAGVNAVSQFEGATFDDLARIDDEKLSMLLRSPDGVGAVRQLEGATFEKLADLDTNKLRVLLDNPTGVDAVRKLEVTFDKLARFIQFFQAQFLQDLLQNPRNIDHTTSLIDCLNAVRMPIRLFASWARIMGRGKRNGQDPATAISEQLSQNSPSLR